MLWRGLDPLLLGPAALSWHSCEPNDALGPPFGQSSLGAQNPLAALGHFHQKARRPLCPSVYSSYAYTSVALCCWCRRSYSLLWMKLSSLLMLCFVEDKNRGHRAAKRMPKGKHHGQTYTLQIKIGLRSTYYLAQGLPSPPIVQDTPKPKTYDKRVNTPLFVPQRASTGATSLFSASPLSASVAATSAAAVGCGQRRRHSNWPCGAPPSPAAPAPPPAPAAPPPPPPIPQAC